MTAVSRGGFGLDWAPDGHQLVVDTFESWPAPSNYRVRCTCGVTLSEGEGYVWDRNMVWNEHVAAVKAAT